jgi:phosphoglycerate dehydrogenase-like enzyme
MGKLLIFPAIDDDRLGKLRRAVGNLEVVNAATSEDALEQIPDADAFFGKLTPDLLARAARLQWVQSPTASLEHYLFPALIEHPCRLSNMRGLFSDVIADHVMGYVLCFARNLPRYLRNQADARWEPVGGEAARAGFETGPGHVSGIDRRHLHLADCTLGVVGVGHIGAEICRRASAFSMRTIGVDPVVRSVHDVVDVVWPMNRLPDLLRESDFVAIAAPHTPETEGMFGASRFALMKPTAFLINIGRGVIVRLDELVQSLRKREIAGAALDVFEIEPLPPEHPLWAMDNVIITPHVAAASPRIAERHFAALLENVRRFAAGDEPLNLVDKTRWF